MSEYRQDRTTGRWVVIAPNRKLRPAATSSTADARNDLRPFDPQCPFCPGNEAELPAIIAEIPAGAPPHWAARVVPNKFPALRPDAEIDAPIAQQVARAGYGFHEVIIESPRHDAELAAMSDDEIEKVVGIYRERTKYLLDRDGIEAVVMFRNQGAQSGASLTHPHAQAIALALKPPMLARLAEHGAAYLRAHGRCATCDEIAIERKARQRIVEETAQFVALVPFAASVPCETWIVPIRHQPSFVEMQQKELGEFARLLRRTLARLRRAQEDLPYNFVFDSAAREDRSTAHFHWRLRLAPQLARWGGFELGAGMPINPSSPEQDAALLRAAPIA